MVADELYMDYVQIDTVLIRQPCAAQCTGHFHLGESELWHHIATVATSSLTLPWQWECACFYTCGGSPSVHTVMLSVAWNSIETLP